MNSFIGSILCSPCFGKLPCDTEAGRPGIIALNKPRLHRKDDCRG